MKVLIVEDENLAVKRLQKLLNEIAEPIEVVGVTKSIVETVDWLRTNEQPEIILLDIELADGQSFEIFNQVEVKSVVIFTTSYNEYALKALNKGLFFKCLRLPRYVSAMYYSKQVR